MQFKQKRGFVLRSPRVGVQPLLRRTGNRLSGDSSSLASSSLNVLSAEISFTPSWFPQLRTWLSASPEWRYNLSSPVPRASSLSWSQLPRFKGIKILIGPAWVRCSPLAQSAAARRVWSNPRTEVVPMVTKWQGQEGRRQSSLKKGGRGGAA